MAERSLETGEKGDSPVSFFDLSAELRNYIYELALTHDRAKGRKANTALLRTCSQVYNEARGILHAQTNLQIDLNVKIVPSGREVRIGGDIHGSVSGNALLGIIWPAGVRQVHTISVRISWYQSGLFSKVSSSNLAAINRVLYSLVVFLTRNPIERRTVFVEVSDIPRHRAFHNTDPKMIEETFYPLAKLPKSFDLQLSEYFNAVRQSINDLRHNAIEETTVRFNTIDMWYETVTAFDDELQALSRRCRRQYTPGMSNIEKQQDALRETNRIMEDEFMTLKNELCLEAYGKVMSKAITRRQQERQQEDGEKRCVKADENEDAHDEEAMDSIFSAKGNVF